MLQMRLTFVATLVILFLESEVNRLSPNDKGIGRPFMGNSLKDSSVRIRMSQKEISELDDLASEMQSTRSGVIRKGIELVKEWLAKRK